MEERESRHPAVLITGASRGIGAAAALTAAAEQTFGGLDALVCSAGIAAPQMLLTDLSTEGWRELMGTNLDGVFHVLRAAVPGFVRRQAGSIVTISSMWGYADVCIRH